MPQYLAPGVYIEEIAGAKPIEGVGTATGAFVGLAEKGPIGEAVLITNLSQFMDTFGGYTANGYLAYAVNQFFQEGGTKCYVVRTCHYDPTKTPPAPTAEAATLKLMDRAETGSQPTLALEAVSRGSWGDGIGVVITSSEHEPDVRFKLTVLYKGEEKETYDDLSVDGAADTITNVSKYIKVRNLRSPAVGPKKRPRVSEETLKDVVVTALAKGLTVEVPEGDSAQSFRLVVKQAGAKVEEHRNLSMQDIQTKVNGISRYIKVAVKIPNPPASPVPPDIPTAAKELPFFALEGGWDGLGQGIQVKKGNDSLLLVSAWREGVKVSVEDGDDAANQFTFVVSSGGGTRRYSNLTLANVEQEVNADPAVEVNLVQGVKPGPGIRPDNIAETAVPSGLSDSDFLGLTQAKSGLLAFDVVDDINIVAIPDRPGDREVIIGAYTYCQNRRDCFFVADPPAQLTPQQMLEFKEGRGDFAGNAFSSSYAALYYPWISMTDPLTGRTKLVPPSGAMAGTYSYTDVVRGVHKAPAGVNEGYLNSAVGIERLVTKGEQELLNPKGINVIRSFPGVGIVMWGARTLSADSEWKYINVRRLLLFIEESIEEGTQWVVFEPNDRSLWAKVKRDATAFLNLVWQSGALFGATAAEAFFVKVDDENNPPESRDAGRLVVDIGVAPVKPAEFVIFRITQRSQGTK